MSEKIAIYIYIYIYSEKKIKTKPFYIATNSFILSLGSDLQTIGSIMKNL